MVVLMLSYFRRAVDPNSSLGKIFLEENVVEILIDKVEGSGDWDFPEYQDTANSGGKKEIKECFFYKMDTKEEEAMKEALALRISKKFALLEEVRPVLETMDYHDKYKKVLDEIWKDKVELDGMIVKEKEEAIKKVKGEALKEKDDPGVFIFPIRLERHVNKNALAYTGSDINTMPYRIYEQLGREEMKKVDKGITMINHTQAEAMGILMNVLC
uniref:Reverse transcriptase domain-containing protein n=1 Tax=Tanacetum cinerariifolium TaxID=118510 RepID=A0A6L2P4M3_TANCI|nr:hypothetical protein [Tanacetum cinerariifolium]